MRYCYILMFVLLGMNCAIAQELSSDLDLENGDVLRCLVQASRSEGWSLVKASYVADGRLELVFLRAGKKRTYLGRHANRKVESAVQEHEQGLRKNGTDKEQLL